MSNFLPFLVPVLMIIVVLFLGAGLWSMTRYRNGRQSQKMMRYRVLAQLVAIIVMMAALYFAGT